jgi:hypothetical protein
MYHLPPPQEAASHPAPLHKLPSRLQSEIQRQPPASMRKSSSKKLAEASTATSTTASSGASRKLPAKLQSEIEAVKSTAQPSKKMPSFRNVVRPAEDAKLSAVTPASTTFGMCNNLPFAPHKEGAP